MNNLFKTLAFIGLSICLTNCSDELSPEIKENNQAFAYFLNQQEVIYSHPDENMICGIDAPYYQIDDEGKIFLQVVDNAGDAPKHNQTIYYRFAVKSMAISI